MDFCKMNQFSESLYKKHRKADNFRSIHDLGNYARKKIVKKC